MLASSCVGPESEAGGGVGLRIEVDQQHRRARLGDAGGHVDRGGGLADAALLVRERVDAGAHAGPMVATRADASGPSRAGAETAPASASQLVRRTTSAAARRPRARRRARRPRRAPRRASAVRVGPPGPQDQRARPAAPAAGTARRATGGGASARASARSNRSRPSPGRTPPSGRGPPCAARRRPRRHRSRNRALSCPGLEQRHRRSVARARAGCRADRRRDPTSTASAGGSRRRSAAAGQRILHQHVARPRRDRARRHRRPARATTRSQYGPKPRVGVFHVLHLGRLSPSAE